MSSHTIRNGTSGPPLTCVKGLPSSAWGTPFSELGGKGWNLASGALPLPVLALSSSAVDHNLATMARWCVEHRCLLAPHGKTTMIPELFRRQLAAGAWGITAATVRQAAVAVAAGASRVIIANEILDPVELALLNELRETTEATFFVFVDSSVGLGRLAATASGSSPQVGVLVEIGASGGRTGVRSEEDALALLREAAASPNLRVAGISGFEGVLPTERDPGPVRNSPITAEAEMRSYVEGVATIVERAQLEGILTPQSIVTAGGSMAFDLIASVLGPLTTTLVLRSGCYVTHDHGIYARSSPLRADPEAPGSGFTPALQLWAHITSVPEPGLAIAGFGRRDANEDAGPPVPLFEVSGPGLRRSVTGWHIDRMWDQHSRLRADVDATALTVGDTVIFGISHPCTAFDKWKVIMETDASDGVIAALETWF